MATDNVTINDLKEDQKKLQAELDKLGTYFGNKQEKLPEAPKTQKKEEPKQLDKRLEQQLDQSKKIMEKFDYLIDLLISTTEEGEGEDLDEIVYTLAQTQAHALVVLSNVKSLVEKTSQEMPSKEEMEKFEKEQRDRYNDLNQKVNLLLEKVEKPAYLKELDYIRVGVSNIQSELKRLEGRVEGIEEIDGETKKLEEKVQKVHKNIKETPQVKQTPQIKKDVQDMNTKVNDLEKTLQKLTKTKTSPEKK